MAWLTYEGRKQGQALYVETELEALNQLEAMKAEFLSEENLGYLIYPNKNDWLFNLEGI